MRVSGSLDSADERTLADCVPDGWVYTNDAWLDPHLTPMEEWRVTGMTRRRRWTRRIYYRDDLVGSPKDV